MCALRAEPCYALVTIPVRGTKVKLSYVVVGSSCRSAFQSASVLHTRTDDSAGMDDSARMDDSAGMETRTDDSAGTEHNA